MNLYISTSIHHLVFYLNYITNRFIFMDNIITFNDMCVKNSKYKHKNFVVYKGIAVEFLGESIPGCEVMEISHSENIGCHYWICQLAPEVSTLNLTPNFKLEGNYYISDKLYNDVISRPDFKKLEEIETKIWEYSPKIQSSIIKSIREQDTNLLDMFLDMNTLQDELVTEYIKSIKF